MPRSTSPLRGAEATLPSLARLVSGLTATPLIFVASPILLCPRLRYPLLLVAATVRRPLSLFLGCLLLLHTRELLIL